MYLDSFQRFLVQRRDQLQLARLVDQSLEQYGAALGDDTRTLLEDAEKATIRAQSLTQQLLTFAKGGEPVKEQTSLAELIMDSAEFVLHGSSSSCHYHLPDDLWLIKADKGQLSQVVQNIVLNAAQSMPGGGIIDISCRNLPRQEILDELLQPDTDYVELCIADRGVGIPPSIREKIFDPYFSTKKEGSGLGLAITLSVINKHEGRITVSSDPGGGTMFTIFLPADGTGPAVAPSRPLPPASGAGRRVLLMDDDEMVLRVGSSMLRSLGYEVLLARDGEECIAVYQEQMKESEPPALVILDLTIPGGKGGVETARELSALDPSIRIIVSSGYSNDPIMASYTDYGFCAAIAKPYVIDTLADVVGRALE